MERYLRTFSGERFVPEAKDYARAESCKSEAKAIAQMNSITDLDKLFRRCIAFVTRGSYGTNAKLWMDRARELGAGADDIIKLYELIIDARLETPNPNEQAPDNSAIIATSVTNGTSTEDSTEEPTEIVDSHATFGANSKLKYFARYNVVLSYCDQKYAQNNHWSSQTTNTWINNSNYVANSIPELIKMILDKYKDVIYAADIIDDRLIIVGYGYGNFGGDLMSSDYAEVADDIVRQSYKEYQRGDSEVAQKVSHNLHAIKLSIPIWVGNPSISVEGYNYSNYFDQVTGLNDYKKLIPGGLSIDPVKKFLNDAKMYDPIAAGKKFYGDRDESSIAQLMRSDEAKSNYVFGPYQKQGTGEIYYQYGYDSKVICYIVNKNNQWWLSKDFKFEDLFDISYGPTWTEFVWDARYLNGRHTYSVQEIRSKVIKPYSEGPLDLTAIKLSRSNKAEYRVIGYGKSGYFCHDYKLSNPYTFLESKVDDILRKYYESAGNAVYEVQHYYGADYKQDPFEFLGIKFRPKIATMQLPDTVNPKVRRVLEKSLSAFDAMTDPTLKRNARLYVEGKYSDGTDFNIIWSDLDRDSIIALSNLRIIAENKACDILDIKPASGGYKSGSVSYFKKQKDYLASLDKVVELGVAKEISPAKLATFKKVLSNYVKELSAKKILYLPSLIVTYNGNKSVYAGNSIPSYHEVVENFKIADISNIESLSISYLVPKVIGGAYGVIKLPEIDKSYISTDPDSLTKLSDGLVQMMEWAKNESRYLVVTKAGLIKITGDITDTNNVATYEVIKLNSSDLSNLVVADLTKASKLVSELESKGKIKSIEVNPEFMALSNPVQDKSLVTKVNNLIADFCKSLNKTYGISNYEFEVEELGRKTTYRSLNYSTTPYTMSQVPTVNDLTKLTVIVTPKIDTKLFDSWESRWGDCILKYTGQSNYLAELRKLLKLKELNDNLSEIYLVIKKNPHNTRVSTSISCTPQNSSELCDVYKVTGNSIKDVLETSEISTYIDYSRSKLKKVVSNGKKDKTITLVQ